MVENIGATAKIGTQPNRENCRKDNLTQIWFYHSTGCPRTFRYINIPTTIYRLVVVVLFVGDNNIVLGFKSNGDDVARAPRLCVFAENISRHRQPNSFHMQQMLHFIMECWQSLNSDR